jgi:hypothetical protein
MVKPDTLTGALDFNEPILVKFACSVYILYMLDCPLLVATFKDKNAIDSMPIITKIPTKKSMAILFMIYQYPIKTSMKLKYNPYQVL